MKISAPGKPDELHYAISAEGYDEVYGHQTQMREHWLYLFEALKTLGPDGIRERQLKAQRIFRDDGATYNPESSASPQSWQLDPVPVLLQSEEWAVIESGLLERAELFNLILKDVYGKRELIHHGVLPPELVFAHGGFLRACQGLSLPGEHQLVLHTTDMVRDSKGEMIIIGDRTQSPSGAGYALENRTVMSRVLPSLFRESHVHRLSLFFQSLRIKLNTLASQITSERPRIVILTPGAYSETYFEHTYLANYLGYPLVQGSDLLVSQGYLYMKSLGGRERVDVVLRRVDDSFCDPVELRGDSQLGVAGLLDVVRSGHVIVVNPLGSGFLENPALLRYLPQISQHFMGRELRLSSAPTYWCGEPQDLAYVLAHLDSLVIKPIIRKRGDESIFGSQLNAPQRQELALKIKCKPGDFVAQVYIQPSNTPSWLSPQLVPRPAVLRTFAVASNSSYTVMPGGLTRIGTGNENMSLSNHRGAISKDTWVLASEPEKQLSLSAHTVATAAGAVKLHVAFPCRVVENLYWMGRYAERAESALRLLRTVFIQLNSFDNVPEQIRLLLRTVTELTGTFPGFTVVDAQMQQQPEAELLSVILDRSRTGSISASLHSLLDCTDQIKEMMSSDTQKVVNDLRDGLSSLKDALQPGLNSAPEEALDPLVTTLLALAGLWQDSMVRALGWRFMDMGRRVEKALQSIRLIRSSLVPVLPEQQQFQTLEAILLNSESLITFRRRQYDGSGMMQGLELLLLDRSNPRSVLYQIALLREHLTELPTAAHGQGLADEDRFLLEASTALQLCSLEQLVAENQETGTRSELEKLLSRVQYLLEATSAQISHKYFDQIKAYHQLVRLDWDGEL
ncbi:hypothetical protein CXF72_04815 [Psychromonas sp. MB-3u-54]|uniref:circularly permuted type 2 ATP-grasp protein n=1 Tax=Psychromonas sp. MB-3u-54 TaxID=2058319 RepID=UPI000C33F85B|nr:circularly permuted type 2 ATP-grasp protein [Psychromonas sp. MB-3u-54]PKH03708.1 hypothetical protein CXF72_04815 [Psychromonas sp. MB-3u-54]